MFIWIMLFLIIVGISFILAYVSMSSYKKNPALLETPYSLFLLQDPQRLSAQVISELFLKLVKNNLIISIEKLFKGQKKALVIYGPVSILKQVTPDLGLIELEDYSKFTSECLVWEMGIKGQVKGRVLQKLPDFALNDEFWWQIVLQPAAKQDNFQANIRVVVKGSNQQKTQSLKTDILNSLKEEGLVSLPQAYSTPKLFKLYQERAFIPGEYTKVNINTDLLLSLL